MRSRIMRRNNDAQIRLLERRALSGDVDAIRGLAALASRSAPMADPDLAVEIRGVVRRAQHALYSTSAYLEDGGLLFDQLDAVQDHLLGDHEEAAAKLASAAGRRRDRAIAVGTFLRENYPVIAYADAFVDGGDLWSQAVTLFVSEAERQELGAPSRQVDARIDVVFQPGTSRIERDYVRV